MRDYVNMKRNVFIGFLIGVVFSVVMILYQHVELFFYFNAAPYFIDTFFPKFVNVGLITFLYFIAFFSLLGYTLSLNCSKKYKILIFVIMVSLHCLLARFGGKALFQDLPEAISNAMPSVLLRNSNSE